MDVYKAIEKRRTIRTFKHSVSEEQLRRIISAGAKAITMKNGKPATQGVCPTCGTKMFRIGKS